MGHVLATTLRRPRDAWIDSGAMEKLREIVLDAYDHIAGLKLSEVPSTAASRRLLAVAR